jgi:hypothetical protein
MDATTEVVIGNSRYQISRVDAETGAFLLYQVMSSIRKAILEDKSEDEPNKQEQPVVEKSPEEKQKEIEEQTAAMIQNLLMNVDRQMFSRIQRDALSVCGQFTAVGEVETILPLLMASGKIAIPSLKFDIQTLVTLTQKSLEFNLLPFFQSGGFKAVMK